MKIFNHLKLLMLVSLALTVATMTARNVDSRTAKTKAILFLNSQTGMRFNASNANVTLTHAEQSQVNTQMNDFYVFNYDGGGYVIVSGDDRAEEILGYGSGYFDMNNLPDNVAWWMDHYKEQIEYLLANPKLQVQTFGQQMSGMLRASNVPALLTCKWDQMYPYNKQCPIDYNSTYNSRSVTGAVATAMAQVMYYWKHPVKLPALDAYVLENTQFMMEALPDTTLNWNNCIDEYTSSFSSAQADAVACLMRYCGQAVHTQYSASYSYANNENMREAMIKFGYSTDATMKYRNDYNATDWHTMMQAELEAGRPILYGGWAGYDEHTFVVDGYNASTNKYHVNFGWSGSSNTYYALDAFTGDGYTFNENQKMIIGLCPAPEAYTCYTSDNTTLTYYYDTQRSTRPGTTYDLNTDVNEPGWRSDNISPSVTQVVFDPSFADARPTSTYYWFSRMSNLVSITGMEYLNTDSVTILRYMFSGCNNLPSLDVSHFNTANVTDMTGMFSSCRSLTSLDLSNFNTANVTDMSNMFYYCNSLTCLDLSSFNTPNVTNMNYMFFRCSELTTIYVGDGWSTEAVTSSPIIFSDCTSLVGGMGTTWNESNPKGKTYAHIDGGPSNPGYFTGQPTGPEAYAVYTSEYSTLTFYYDKLRITRTGTTYDLNEGEDAPGWYNDLLVVEDVVTRSMPVTRVVFNSSFAGARPTSTAGWFEDMDKLQSITGIEYLNTEDVTTMYSMFDGCSGLTALDVSLFNTDNVTNMANMFEECKNLTSLDVSNFNTANVDNMHNMFAQCSGLTSIDVSSFNTANVTDMGGMFDSCSGLTSLDLTGFDTENVNDMNCMFAGCSGLTSLDLSHFNTRNVIDMSRMFIFCDNLASVDLINFNTVNVTDMWGMFSDCPRLTSLDLSSFNTTLVTNMVCMFDSCTKLKTIGVSDEWSTAAVTTSGMMFNNCTSLVGGMGTTWDAGHTDAEYARIDGGPSNPGYFTARNPEAYACYTSDNTTLTFYYDGHRSSRPGRTYALNEGTNMPAWYNDHTYSSITQVVFDPSFAAARPISTLMWFRDMENLTTITGISYLNTSNVTNMQSMFLGCNQLTSIDVSSFDTSSATNIAGMFGGCSSLTSLDLSNFNTTGVTTMIGMFKGCTGLKRLNLSSFNTANVTSMMQMFADCTGLTRLELGNFNTAKVVNMMYMFSGCTNLATIYVGDDWSTAAVTSHSYMFTDCTSLVGGMGTTYDASHVDKAYARIDGGPRNPGYFTERHESYAVLTQDDRTLTFYYDTQRSTRPGITFDTENPGNGMDWMGYSDMITRVAFDPSYADARPTSTAVWFSNLSRLTSISGMEYLNTEDVISMASMFWCCSALTSLDLSSFNTANVINMYSMFEGCSNLTTICVGDGWTTDAVIWSDNMFLGCTSLVGGMGTTYDANHIDAAYAHIDGGPDNPGYFSEKPTIEAYAVYTLNNSTLTFYYDDQRSTRPGMTYGLNTGTEEMEWHDNPYFFTRVVFDPSYADARPKTTYGWFCDMTNLESITGMEYLNTDSVTNMAYMFDGCSKLTSLDLSHFNTSNVTSMESMFSNCRGLTNLDLTSFNTDNVTTMYCMFNYSMGLTSVDLSSFTNARVENMDNMFEGCFELRTIYASSSWSTAAVTTSWAMFIECNNLVGGMGTTYDENHVEADYAHIDGGPSNPGYFTEKISFVPGDVNGDNNVNVADVTALISLVLSGNASAADYPAGDMNGDGNLNISDVTALISRVLSGA